MSNSGKQKFKIDKRSYSWRTVPLGSEVRFLSGGTPSKSEPKYWGGKIPWVSSAEMTQGRIEDTDRRVTEEGADNGTKRVPPKTVLIVVRGMSLAKEFRVAITSRDVTFNQDLKALLPSENVHAEFLYYYLLSQNGPIKRRIALLEKMAEEIYREWFVRMRFPGHEKVKFKKGVPDGWKKVRLEKAFKFTGGGTPSKKTERYWIEITDLRVFIERKLEQMIQ
jgi:type I restriction enzyme S subunit